jgi:hypothetical protein
MSGLAEGRFIEPQCHEFKAQYNFDAGLDAIFAADSRIKDGGGSVREQFAAFGEVWSVSLSYTADNGLMAPEGNETPHGTEWQIDNIREYELKVDAVEGDDAAGQKSFYSRLRPRWDRMRTQDSKGNIRSLSVPFDEGYNLKVQGSNIDFEHYQQLIKQAFLAVGLSGSYFDADARHESSTLTQAEVYVRVHEQASGPIHARDGPLARLGHLLEHDRGGRRRIEQADVTETGEVCPGFRHQAGVDEKRVQQVWPKHQLPKQFKHYKVREATSVSGTLSHPKVGCIFYPKLWRDRSNNWGVSQSDIQQLYRELESGLLSILHDAGLDVTSSQSYVSDDYFCADTSERSVNVVDLPLEEIEHDQQSVVIKHLSDGLSPIQQQTLETLVTDGGTVAPQDIADDGNFHHDSVYRCLDTMDDLIEREYGSVSLRSTHVADLVHTAVEEAKERTREAVKAGARAVEAAERGLDESTQAFLAWASRYIDGYQEETTHDGVHINVGTLEETFDDRHEAKRRIRKLLRDGLEKWRAMGKDEIQWRLGRVEAEFQYEKDDYLRSLHDEPPLETERIISRVSRLMKSGTRRPTR